MQRIIYYYGPVRCKENLYIFGVIGEGFQTGSNFALSRFMELLDNYIYIHYTYVQI